jgi:hypothetical protein
MAPRHPVPHHVVVRSLFDLVVPPEKADVRFLGVRDSHAFTAARRLMNETFATFRDVDGTFVQQFQSSGFSPRVWELALHAYLKEAGLTVERPRPAPDFLVTSPITVAIEAATANPTQVLATGRETNVDSSRPSAALSDPATWSLLPADVNSAQAEFVFQVGKALRRKLLHRDADGRAYWQLPHTEDAPFVIAVEAFHHDSSLYHSVSALAQFLYGLRPIAERDETGRLNVRSESITSHSHAGKIIPSAWFAEPDAAHVSAVLFSNAGTISQFSRIGTERGYGPEDVAIARFGTAVDPDPDAELPALFSYIVGDHDPGCEESFAEGLHVLHNPWARTPLPEGALPGTTEHQVLPDGRIQTTHRGFTPFTSITAHFSGPDAREHAAAFLASWERGWCS